MSSILTRTGCTSAIGLALACSGGAGSLPTQAATADGAGRAVANPSAGSLAPAPGTAGVVAGRSAPAQPGASAGGR